jgi:carboxylate-amine ligase
MKPFGYSFGLEEEFFLSRGDTGALALDRAAPVIEDARESLGDCITAEMLQSQVEIVSPVFNHMDEALAGMIMLRRKLADSAALMGLCPTAAGTHPLGAWRAQLVSAEPRYEQLLADFRIVGHRNLVCGLHVHVAVPSHADRVDVMNRVMRWLPLFLALSTSSPFWNGRPTGLLSYRQTLYDEWPRSGVPDFFKDEADYDSFAARMSRVGAIDDGTQLWWSIRPALHFPTLELRIADACTYVQDAVAIAALFRCLIATAVRHPSFGRKRTTHTRRIIDENRWRAKRDGIRAHLILEMSDEVVPVQQVLERLLSLISEDAERLHCLNVLIHLHGIFRRGTSAQQQLAIYKEGRLLGLGRVDALRRVLVWLNETTLREPDEPVAPETGTRPPEDQLTGAVQPPL